MRKYKVQITNEALRDMKHIYEYIADNLYAPSAALNLYNKIADAIESLSTMPARIKIMDSEPEHMRGIRRMNVDKYSVFFIIHDDKVIVTNVLYGSSDVSARLH